jgi:hypothetical protein
VQSALTLAMPTGGDSPPMGWTPMPDPADSGVGSPPFPVNRALTPSWLEAEGGQGAGGVAGVARTFSGSCCFTCIRR